MDTSELITELRAARPIAPSALRERITVIASQPPEPRGSTLRRLSLRRTALVLVPVAATLALGAAGAIGLSRSSVSVEAGPATTLEAVRESDASSPPVPGATGSEAGKAGPAGTVAPSTDRAQQVSASLVLEVEDGEAVSQRTQEALSITRSLGGYVVSMSVATAESGSATMTLRVPTEKMQDALARLSELGRILSQQVQIDDLQEGLDAFEARERTLQAQIARLTARLQGDDLDEESRAVLRTRRAALQAELLEVRAAIEQTNDRASMATVYLAIQTPDTGVAVPVPSRLDRALDEALNVLAWEGVVLLAALIVLAPVLLVGLAVWLVQRTQRRRAEDELLAAP